MTTIQKAGPFDLTLVIMTMAIWGLAFVAMKIAVPETGPFWLAFYRTGFGFLIILPFLLIKGLEKPDGAQQWLYLAIIVCFNTSLPIVLIAFAELTLDAGVAALLMGAGPFIALILGHFITNDERFSLIKLLAVLMGFAGILLIVGVETLAKFSVDKLIAELALVLASLMYVIAGFTVRRVKLPPLSLAFWSLGGGTLLLLPISFYFSGPFPHQISMEVLSWLAFAGFFGTGLGFVLRYHLISKIGYSMFSIGVNLIPVFGVFFGALILGETITLNVLLALILIVGGLFVARKS